MLAGPSMAIADKRCLGMPLGDSVEQLEFKSLSDCHHEGVATGIEVPCLTRQHTTSVRVAFTDTYPLVLCHTSSGYQVWGACVCRDSIRQGQCLGVCDHTNDDGGVTTRELGACCTAAADSLTRSGSHVPIACVATPVQTPESWIDIHTAAATAMAYAPQQRTLYGLLLTTSVCTARYEPDNERLATCGEDSRLNVLSLSNKPPLWTATEKAGCGFADVCFQSDCVLISAGYACMVTLLQPVCAITLVSQRTVPAVTSRASPHAQLKLWDIRKHKPEALFREYAWVVWGSETGRGAPWLTLPRVVAAVLQQAPCCTPSRPILWSSTLSRRAQVMA